MPDTIPQAERSSLPQRIFTLLETIVEGVALTAFIVMMLVTLLQVVTRYFLHIAMPWTEELARTLFIGAMMIGIALAVRRREHIVVDFLIAKRSPRSQAMMQIAFGVAILFFLSVWLRGALRLVEVNRGSSYVTLTWLGVSDIYRIEAFAIGLMIIFVLLDLVRQARILRQPPREAP